MCDLAIIGGGPAGMAAAINASSDGLKVVLIDSKETLGGQVTESASVQNYPGFTMGIPGRDLMKLFMEQTVKFKTRTLRPVRVHALRQSEGLYNIDTDDNESPTIRAKSVILAIGLSYKRLSADGVSDFVGRGASYGMPIVDKLEEDHCFCIVGGANSAGQAAVHLATVYPDCKVTMVVRGKGIEDTMSKYLLESISNLPNINLLVESKIVKVAGNSHIEQIIGECKGVVEPICLKAHNLCIFIGASPKAQWLPAEIEKTSRGFICTGRKLTTWNLPRSPLSFETSFPGVFACGDVQEGSVKRVTTSVGAAVVAVTEVHEYLKMQQIVS